MKILYNIIDLFVKYTNPKMYNFKTQIDDNFFQTFNQLKSIERKYSQLCINWLAVIPHTFLLDLFMKKKSGFNNFFVNMFNNSDMHNPVACFHNAQAYFLYVLYNIINNDKQYENFYIIILNNRIKKYMMYGDYIINTAKEIEKDIFNNYCHEVYIDIILAEKLIDNLYYDQNNSKQFIYALRIDSKAILGFSIYVNTIIQIAKKNDKK